MLHRTNRERYKWIKKLDRNQKELYKWFKDIFYQKRCNGDKVEKNVQDKIKELIFSSNYLLECRLISENKHKISCNLPYEDEGEKQNEVFIKLLDVINEKNIGLENVHFFDEPSIFTVLRYVENISNNLDKVDKDKIMMIKLIEKN